MSKQKHSTGVGENIDLSHRGRILKGTSNAGFNRALATVLARKG